MRQRELSSITAAWIAAGIIIVALIIASLLSGCAMLQIGTTYKTFELTIDGQKVVANLPNELPSMEKAELAGEECFNTTVCRQRFCVSEDLGHDHVDFIYMGTDVIALVWVRSNETEFDKRFIAWIYIEGKPVSAPISRIQELVKEHDQKDSGI